MTIIPRRIMLIGLEIAAIIWDVEELNLWIFYVANWKMVIFNREIITNLL